MKFYSYLGFPGSSAGKESACNEGDPGSIPGSGRCPGEGIGYPLQYSCASLVPQMVKKPPAVQVRLKPESLFQSQSHLKSFMASASQVSV